MMMNCHLTSKFSRTGTVIDMISLINEVLINIPICLSIYMEEI